MFWKFGNLFKSDLFPILLPATPYGSNIPTFHFLARATLGSFNFPSSDCFGSPPKKCLKSHDTIEYSSLLQIILE